MTDLDFRCTGVRPEPFGASPTLLFGLRIEERDHLPVHAVALRCQLRIEPAKRTYDPDEVDMLGDLFGEPDRWSSTLKPLQFAHASITVPAFSGTTHVDLPVPCTYDTEVASASYFRALARGEIPLLMLFSGTVFTGHDRFRAEPIPWHKEASCLMPVAVWRELIEAYFPNTGWLRLRKDCLEDLRRYRSAHALPSWERVVEDLLAAAGADGAAEPTHPEGAE